MQGSKNNVRARTLVHLQHLVAATATLSGCSRALPGGTISPPGAPDAASSTTTPLPVVTPVVPPTGYAVVDPMPTPARCYGTSASVTSRGAWRKDSTGLYAEVELTPNPSSGASFAVTPSPSPDVDVMGGVLMSSALKGATVVIKLRPLPGNTFMSASLQVSCATGAPTPGTVIATMNFATPKPKEGAAFTVTLMDR